MRPRFCIVMLVAFYGVVAAPIALAAPEEKAANPDWVEPMQKVHRQFKGKVGSLAQFGDSITVTMAYWTPLGQNPTGLSKEGAAALQRVQGYMQADCWRAWKGPEYGSESGKTIRWADDHIDDWLKKLNPEAAIMMFGTNDLGQVPLEEYEKKLQRVVDRCLRNSTVVILSTIPPRSGQLEKSERFADAARRIAKDRKLPLIDFHAEVLRRRPKDWDGSSNEFKGKFNDVYDAPTLISGDGVHPSAPKSYQGFSDEALQNNGYALRSYLSLMMYLQVIDVVLDEKRGK